MEAGAFNGEDLSNTLALEVEKGWTGILIEPNPANYRLLKAKHRKAWTAKACLAVDGYPQKVNFMVQQNG